MPQNGNHWCIHHSAGSKNSKLMGLSFRICPLCSITNEPATTELIIAVFVHISKDGLQKAYGVFTSDEQRVHVFSYVQSVSWLHSALITFTVDCNIIAAKIPRGEISNMASRSGKYFSMSPNPIDSGLTSANSVLEGYSASQQLVKAEAGRCICKAPCVESGCMVVDGSYWIQISLLSPSFTELFFGTIQDVKDKGLRHSFSFPSKGPATMVEPLIALQPKMLRDLSKKGFQPSRAKQKWLQSCSFQNQC